MAARWWVGNVRYYPDSDGKEFGITGDFTLGLGHLCLIQGIVLGSRGLGVVLHLYHA